MKTHKFNVANPWLVFPTLIISFFPGIKLSFYVQNLEILSSDRVLSVSVSLIVAIFFIAFMVWLIACAKIEATFDDDTVSIKWVRQFLFNKNQDLIIPFNEIATYATPYSGPNWDCLKINMTNGDYHEFCQMWISNNFSNFVKAFVSAVDNYNKKIRESAKKSGLRDKPKTIERKYRIYR